MDLAEFADEKCDPDDLLVNPKNGVVYLESESPGKYGEQMVSHKYGTHSAPWYLYQVNFKRKLTPPRRTV